ncbi:Mss4p nuclear export [Tilletia horrida]|uniref:Mss4p nuclear export n=1 Tax=Tilletia horrida TaxID=155126 RepID=A0AAN6JX77_9BASI|nr:Mss4p nuclear export [Tilletia horrida]
MSGLTSSITTANKDTTKKRKHAEAVTAPASNAADPAPIEQDDDDDDDEDDDTPPSSINVDFAFLTPDPAVDHQALRRLLQQLFYTHSPSLNLHALADITLSQAAHLGLGTVVKLDLPPTPDEEPDPYAIISAVPATAVPADLTAYVQARLGSNQAFLSALTSSSASTLYLFHERMVNLPPLLAPPLYRILLSELAPLLSANASLEPEAAKLAQPFQQLASSSFSPKNIQVLFFTRLYSEAAFSDDEDEEMEDGNEANGAGGNKKKPAFAQRRAQNQKRRKQAEQRSAAASGQEGSDLHYFHPEDEILIKHATHTQTFRFPPPPSAVSTFEAPIFGRLFLLPLSALIANLPEASASQAEIELGPALKELDAVLASSSSS